MRIGIDARLVTYRRGIGNLVYNLLWALAEKPTTHEFILYVDSPHATKHVPDDPRFVLKVLRPNLYPIWEQIALPLQVKRDQLDVLYCPANTAPLWLPDTGRLVLTVADVMYLLPPTAIPTSPSLYQRVGRLYLKWIVPQVARPAAAVTTISQYSRSDLLKYLAIEPSRVIVIHLAPGSAFRKIDNASVQAIRLKFRLGERLIIALGAIDPRKNTARVIEAFARFKNQVSGDYQLVIVGLSLSAQSHFSRQVRQSGVDDKVILRGYVTEDELVALYNTAEMMLYPSLYEGFGLPLLEAMACGTPVISSTAASLPEIASDAAVLVDPTDTEALVQAMVQVSSNEAFRKELIVRGYQQVAKFSWAKTAQEMLAVYEMVANQ